MQQAENMLVNQGFLKAHRSFLVNTNFVNKIEKHQVTIGKEEIPIGGGYYESLILALSPGH